MDFYEIEIMFLDPVSYELIWDLESYLFGLFVPFF